MDKTHVPYPGCYCADCVEGTPPTQGTNPMTTTREAEVTQADREAAASLAEWLTAAQSEWENMPIWFAKDAPKAFRDGAFDGHEWPQAFARHRQSAERGEVVAVARKFNLGDRVTKTKGSSWTGLVVGFYSTSLTPIGYAVESENEPGSVQIYPESALDAVRGKQ